MCRNLTGQENHFRVRALKNDLGLGLWPAELGFGCFLIKLSIKEILILSPWPPERGFLFIL